MKKQVTTISNACTAQEDFDKLCVNAMRVSCELLMVNLICIERKQRAACHPRQLTIWFGIWRNLVVSVDFEMVYKLLYG